MASAISIILPLGKLSPLEVQQVSGFLIHEIYMPAVYSSDLIVPAKLEPKAKEKMERQERRPCLGPGAEGKAF